MIRALFFDVDGTLIDSNDQHAQAWVDAFAQFGCDIAFSDVRQQIGKGGDNLMPALLPEEMVAQKGEEIEAWRSERFKQIYMPTIDPFPKVRELFELIVEDSRRIILASSAKEDELDEYIALLECGDLISGTTSADDVSRSKPDADIFRAALDQVSPAKPDEVFVIGDTPYDVIAAAKLGIGTVALRSGGFPDTALREAGCLELYDDVAELLERYGESVLSR